MTGKDKLFFGIVIICMFMLGFLIYFVLGQSGQCLKNPFIYGANHNVKGAYCTCTQDKASGCPAYFFFNSSTFDSKPNKCGTGEMEHIETNLNLSEFFKPIE